MLLLGIEKVSWRRTEVFQLSEDFKDSGPETCVVEIC